MAHVKTEQGETKVILTMNEREAALVAHLLAWTSGPVSEAGELFDALNAYHAMADDLFTYSVNQWNHVITPKS